MNIQSTFSSFSVDSISKARRFYSEVLGLSIKEKAGMGLDLTLPGGGSSFIYPKDDHKPAVFTVLNLIVDDIYSAVDELEAHGIEMEKYDLGEFKPDEKGIYHSDDPAKGPTIAWFKDQAGNILSFIEETNYKGGE